jgi:glutamine synthetase
VFDQIAKGGATSSKDKGTLMIGVDTLPVLPTDPGDRNRTSPFAFTGNRFEFRAAGSGQTIAGPMVTINTILAESLDYIATELETAVAAGTDFNTAVQRLLEEIITSHGSVVFNGDGYSADWQTEAAARGLPNLRTTLDALPELIAEPALELFDKYGVFSQREMHSRFEIGMEQYVLSVGVEARSTLEIGATVVLPAAIRYQTELAQNVAALKAAGIESAGTWLEELSTTITSLRNALALLRAELGTEGNGSIGAEAQHARDGLLPAMTLVRSAADELESMVADDLWPLPTYQEMLFML